MHALIRREVEVAQDDRVLLLVRPDVADAAQARPRQIGDPPRQIVGVDKADLELLGRFCERRIQPARQLEGAVVRRLQRPGHVDALVQVAVLEHELGARQPDSLLGGMDVGVQQVFHPLIGEAVFRVAFDLHHHRCRPRGARPAAASASASLAESVTSLSLLSHAYHESKSSFGGFGLALTRLADLGPGNRDGPGRDSGRSVHGRSAAGMLADRVDDQPLGRPHRCRRRRESRSAPRSESG